MTTKEGQNKGEFICSYLLMYTVRVGCCMVIILLINTVARKMAHRVSSGSAVLSDAMAQSFLCAPCVCDIFEDEKAERRCQKTRRNITQRETESTAKAPPRLWHHTLRNPEPSTP